MRTPSSSATGSRPSRPSAEAPSRRTTRAGLPPRRLIDRQEHRVIEGYLKTGPSNRPLLFPTFPRTPTCATPTQERRDLFRHPRDLGGRLPRLPHGRRGPRPHADRVEGDHLRERSAPGVSFGAADLLSGLASRSRAAPPLRPDQPAPPSGSKTFSTATADIPLARAIPSPERPLSSSHRFEHVRRRDPGRRRPHPHPGRHRKSSPSISPRGLRAASTSSRLPSPWGPGSNS